MSDELLTAFPPVHGKQPRILILGSMPGIASLQQQQYYAHPRNAFWPIMQALLSIDKNSGYLQRIQQLSENHVALWDVARQCVRPGSLDTAIQDQTVIFNDFESFLQRHHQIRHIFFNGGKSAQMFNKHVFSGLSGQQRAINFTQLPSTSPANARYSLQQKIDAWKVILDALNCK